MSWPTTLCVCEWFVILWVNRSLYKKGNLGEKHLEVCSLWEVKPVYFLKCWLRLNKSDLLSLAQRNYKIQLTREPRGCLLACRWEHVLVSIWVSSSRHEHVCVLLWQTTFQYKLLGRVGGKECSHLWKEETVSFLLHFSWGEDRFQTADMSLIQVLADLCADFFKSWHIWPHEAFVAPP